MPWSISKFTITCMAAVAVVTAHPERARADDSVSGLLSNFFGCYWGENEISVNHKMSDKFSFKIFGKIENGNFEVDNDVDGYFDRPDAVAVSAWSGTFLSILNSLVILTYKSHKLSQVSVIAPMRGNAPNLIQLFYSAVSGLDEQFPFPRDRQLAVSMKYDGGDHIYSFGDIDVFKYGISREDAQHYYMRMPDDIDSGKTGFVAKYIFRNDYTIDVVTSANDGGNVIVNYHQRGDETIFNTLTPAGVPAP